MSNWMLTILICLLMLGEFVFGFFVMRRVGRFLEKNSAQKQDLCCGKVILSGRETDEKILQTLRQFRKNHDKIRIMIYDVGNKKALYSAEDSDGFPAGDGGSVSHAADQ